jgi:hypothetical protein
VHLFEILRRWRARGHTVTWLAANFPGGAEEDERDGIRIVRAGAWWNANHALPAAYRRRLAGERFDAVIEDINKLPFLSPRWTRAPVLAVVPHPFGRQGFAETVRRRALRAGPRGAHIPATTDVPFAISESTRDDRRSRHP